MNMIKQLQAPAALRCTLNWELSSPQSRSDELLKSYYPCRESNLCRPARSQSQAEQDDDDYDDYDCDSYVA
jgi:hypothetical protein